jgi:hypothetical protein
MYVSDGTCSIDIKHQKNVSPEGAIYKQVCRPFRAAVSLCRIIGLRPILIYIAHSGLKRIMRVNQYP